MHRNWIEWWVTAALVVGLALTGCSDDGGGSASEGPQADTGDESADTVETDTGEGEPDTGEEGSDADAGEEGEDTPEGDVGDPDVGDTEGGEDTETPVEQGASVTHVHTADGETVGVLFGAELDEGTGDFLFVSSEGDEVAGSVVNVEVEGTGSYVEVAAEETLDSDATWELVMTDVTANGGEALLGSIGGVWTGDIHGTIFLNLVWHQHQPSYLDPGLDQLQGPWVRKHATKDYVDMTLELVEHSNIHFNVNLTSSLLNQVDFYIQRMGPHIDLAANAIDEEAFLGAWADKTDPWIDLLLVDTPAPEEATEEQLDLFYSGVWSCLSIAEPLRGFFPEYDALATKPSDQYTQLDLLHLKLWFELAWMDPDFLDGAVELYVPEGGDAVVIDLSDVVEKQADGTYLFDSFYTDESAGVDELITRGEALANRLVVENYKLLVATFEVHKAFSTASGTGQVEVLTTPFFHPILPLLHNTDLAAESKPADALPEPAFSHPEDVETQIAMAVKFYADRFGAAPRGMWPSEGSVAEEIVPAFANNGIEWISTDRQVLERGKPGSTHLAAYRVDADTTPGPSTPGEELMIVFRDTELSDKVGFFYQSNPPQDNADDFIAEVFSDAPRWGEGERVLSVILDGENAWEWYTQDHDAKQFLDGMYTHLGRAYDTGAVITVTGSEYIDGNPERQVPAHPVAGLEEYEDLFPGSWIGSSFDTWIGENEENQGWLYLVTARADLAAAAQILEGKLPAFSPEELLVEPAEPAEGELAWWNAWRAMLSAEGSDWFWWYGSDQTAAGGDDTPFDTIFRAQLDAMYAFMNEALVAQGEDPIDVPTFTPIIQPEPSPLGGPFMVEPSIDGVIADDPAEWVPPGGLIFDNDTAGAIDNPDDDISRVFFGYSQFNNGTIFIAVDANEDLSEKLGTDYRLVFYTNHNQLTEGPDGAEITGDPFNTETEEGLAADLTAGGAARQVVVDFASGVAEVSLAEADGEGGWTPVDEHEIEVGGPTEGGSVVELKAKLSDLGMSLGDPFEFIVVAAEGLTAVDRAPNLGSVVMFSDPTKLVTVTLEVDVTGSQIPIDEYIAIQDPPPPAGTGLPSIVGNQPEFSDWTPNSVFLRDDGMEGDAEADDQIWSIQFVFPPGTGLQYKYTIGQEGESWGGTEEYPLTNRGYTVPTDGTTSVRVRDVFADRPEPTGSTAALTTVTIEE